LAVIVACFTEKGWTGTRVAREFPNKKWNYRSINPVLAKCDEQRFTKFRYRKLII